MPRSWSASGSTRQADAAVSDIIGSVLMVGITVMMAGGMAILILSFDGPSDQVRAQLAMSVDPGTGGWASGDEKLRILHLGGEPVNEGATAITYTVLGTTTTVTGTGLDFGPDNKITVGEQWLSASMTLQQVTPVQAFVSVQGGKAMIASGTVSGSSQAVGSTCTLDTTAPVAGNWAQAPSNVQTSTTGAVSVTATLADDCVGVDPAVVPRLFWRINDGTNPAYTDQGVMTSLGGSQWTANIPSQAWATHVNKNLQYYLSPLRDLNANTGASTTQTDLVDLVLVFTYVNTNTPTTGTVGAFANMRSASDGGLEGTVLEAGTLGPPGSASGTLGGSATANNGAATPANALTGALSTPTDATDARAVLNAAGEWVEASGFTAPPTATGITAVTIGFEGRKESGGGTSPIVLLSYTVSGVPGVSTQAATLSSTTDGQTTRVVTADRAWTIADIGNLAIRVAATTLTNRDVGVDHIYVTISYTTAGTTTYAANVQFDWTGVPPGTTQTLELNYHVTASADTFSVQVWDGAAWRTCTGALSATAATAYTCTLLPAEYLAGLPRIRIVDVNAAGTVPTTLYIEYLRVSTL